MNKSRCVEVKVEKFTPENIFTKDINEVLNIYNSNENIELEWDKHKSSTLKMRCITDMKRL